MQTPWLYRLLLALTLSALTGCVLADPRGSYVNASVGGEGYTVRYTANAGGYASDEGYYRRSYYRRGEMPVVDRHYIPARPVYRRYYRDIPYDGGRVYQGEGSGLEINLRGVFNVHERRERGHYRDRNRRDEH